MRRMARGCGAAGTGNPQIFMEWFGLGRDFWNCPCRGLGAPGRAAGVGQTGLDELQDPSQKNPGKEGGSPNPIFPRPWSSSVIPGDGSGLAPSRESGDFPGRASPAGQGASPPSAHPRCVRGQKILVKKPRNPAQDTEGGIFGSFPALGILGGVEFIPRDWQGFLLSHPLSLLLFQPPARRGKGGRKESREFLPHT